MKDVEYVNCYVPQVRYEVLRKCQDFLSPISPVLLRTTQTLLYSTSKTKSNMRFNWNYLPTVGGS